MGKYRKVIAVVIVLSLLLLADYFNLAIPGVNELFMTIFKDALIAFAVFQPTNDPL